MKNLFIMIFVCMVNSVMAQTEIESMVTGLAKLRLGADSTLRSTPYRNKEHQAIKDYFVGLKDFTIAIKENSRTNKRLNSYLGTESMKKFCSDIFISQNDWDQIKVNCTRNRYFLCTEDVNEYPAGKQALSELFYPNILQVFRNTSECQ
jgi:hypothetical protein